MAAATSKRAPKRRPPVGSAAKTRNRPAECSAGCGWRFRISRTQMARGLGACGACGAPMWPVELEDVLAYGPEDHPLAWGYAQELDKIVRGQAPHAARCCKLVSGMREPHDIASERIAAETRRQARARQLAALQSAHVPGAWGQTDTTTDPIPF